MRIVATVEARMTSSRLPGKVLMPILGQPMLKFLIERVKRSRLIDEIVVATTNNDTDDPIVKLCRMLGVGVYRGSEDDVLERVLKAARTHKADIIVETTGDCPLLDPQIIDQVIQFYLDHDFDYVSNVLTRSYPRGFDVQVFSQKVLSETADLTQDPADRENVSLYIYEHPERYRLGNVLAPKELYWPDLRICVDTQEDFKLVETVFSALYMRDPQFGAEEIVSYIRWNNLDRLNQHVVQKLPRIFK